MGSEASPTAWFAHCPCPGKALSHSQLCRGTARLIWPEGLVTTAGCSAAQPHLSCEIRGADCLQSKARSWNSGFLYAMHWEENKFIGKAEGTSQPLWTGVPVWEIVNSLRKPLPLPPRQGTESPCNWLGLSLRQHRAVRTSEHFPPQYQS